MSKARVYLETSVISYLTARLSRDLVTVGRQELAREWWEQQRTGFQLFVSEFVVTEAALGDQEAARRPTEVLESLDRYHMLVERVRTAGHLHAGGVDGIVTDKNPQDEIIAEVRSNREELAARFDYDVDLLYEEAKRLERASGREVLKAAPKRVQAIS